MDVYLFYIFSSHAIVLEDMEEDGSFTTTCDLVEIGQLNGLTSERHPRKKAPRKKAPCNKAPGIKAPCK